MVTVAEFTIPPESLPFGDTLVEQPSMRIEVERIVPTVETALPFFWVWGTDPEVFIEAAGDEPEIEETRLLETVDDGALFRAEWSPDAEVVKGLQKLDATILDSRGTSDRWRFKVRARTRDRFANFQEVFQEQGIPVNLIRIYDLTELIEGEHRALTRHQRETLITAYREGYFENPRKVTQAELGDRFDISHRAISERLRRGTRNLVATSLLPDATE